MRKISCFLLSIFFVFFCFAGCESSEKHCFEIIDGKTFVFYADMNVTGEKGGRVLIREKSTNREFLCELQVTHFADFDQSTGELIEGTERTERILKAPFIVVRSDNEEVGYDLLAEGRSYYFYDEEVGAFVLE